MARHAMVLFTAVLLGGMVHGLPDADAAPNTVAEKPMAVGPEQQRAVLDYWTPERIAELTEPPSGNPPKSGPDGAPWTGANALDRTVGRLFFTDHGQDVSCTATVVDSANRSTIVTAGHCVHNTDLLGADPRWVSHALFIPGYRDGKAPFGKFTARLAVVDATWLRDDQQHGSVYNTYDQAFLALNRNGRGQRVQDAVDAAQRIGFDTPGEVRVAEFGYPRASSDPAREGLPEYTGARLAYCAGRGKEHPGTPENPDAPNQWGVACSMGGGASGGPRIAEFSPSTGIGTVVGDATHSAYFGPAGEPCPPESHDGCVRYLVGPQFTEAVTKPLYERAQQR